MYVYFIRARDYVKIGKANVPEVRLQELQVGNPVPLVLLAKLPCRGERAAEHLEFVLQSVLRRYQIRGEWFEYGPIARVLKELPSCNSVDDMCRKIRSHFAHQRAKRIERKARREGVGV